MQKVERIIIDLKNYVTGAGIGEQLLMGCIVFFLLAIFIFLLLILVHRLKKRNSERGRKKYAAHIEESLFSIAFDNLSMSDLREKEEFSRNWEKKPYRDQFLKDLIKLHRLYDGEIARNLQVFYRTSGLLRLSYNKIRNQRWYLKCEGIQELSKMEITKAAPIIREYTNSKIDTLKMVAIIEFLHLIGLKGLLLLKDYEEPLNDWIQLNLLESIKEADKTDLPEFDFLLESTNHSLVVFGLRLVSLFHQNQYLEQVRALQRVSHRQVRIQANNTLRVLSPTG